MEWPLPPMLGKLVRELPRGDVLYEPKWDGFRALARREGAEVDIRSRHGNPLARYFPELVAPLLQLTTERFVLDGEIVPDDGDFPALMQRLHPAASRVERLAREAPASLIAFDLLAVDDEVLLERPFAERRALLSRLLASAPARIRLTHATRDADEGARWLDEHEGVIAKPLDLAYGPGKRWLLKVKRERTADCVVAGFRWRVDRPLPSSLLLALYDDAGALEHVGVAASFGVRQAESLLETLEPQRVALEGHPWEHGFLVGGGAVGRLRGAAGRWVPGMTMDWTPVAPALVAEVGYDQVDAGRFRHPARFKRWRPDRDPRSCTLDQLVADSHEVTGVQVTSRERVLFPETGFTKGDLADYYAAVSDVLVPHLAGRPLSLRRFPEGVEGPSWFQDECRGAPEFVRTHEWRGRRFCVVDSREALLWIANLSAIELHPYAFTVDDPASASELVFDLDPGEDATIVDCCAVALRIRERFASARVKTSGLLGLHVVVPGAWEDAKGSSRAVAETLAADLPDRVTTVQRRSERRGRVLVDWLQNDPARSTVAPYSVRAAPWPLVSTPLDWDEVERATDPRELIFDTHDAVERVARRGDLFS